MSNPFLEQNNTNPYLEDIVEVEDIYSYSHSLQTRVHTDLIPGVDAQIFANLSPLPMSKQREVVTNSAQDDFFRLTADSIPEMSAGLGIEATTEVVSNASNDAPQDYSEAVAWLGSDNDSWNIDALQQAKMASFLGDAKWTEYLTDIFIPTATWDASQLTGGGYLEVEKQLRDLHYAYAGMSPEEKVDNIDTILSVALEYTEGNRVTATTIANAIFQGPGTEFWWDRVGLALLPLDILGGAKSVVTATNGAVKTTNAAMKARNLVQRASVIDSTILDPNLAKVAGTATNNVQLGVYDQINILDTGMPRETAFELDEFSRLTEEWVAATDDATAFFQQKTAEQGLHDLDIKGIGSKLKRLFLPPDNALGAVNEEQLVVPRFLAESKLAFIRDSFTKRLHSEVLDDVRASGQGEEWTRLLNQLDEDQAEWTYEQFVNHFKQLGVADKQSNKAATAALKRRQLTQVEYIELDKLMVSARTKDGYTKSMEITPEYHLNVRPFDEVSSAKASMTETGVDVLWDFNRGKRVSKVELDDVVIDGRQVVRTRLGKDPVNMVGSDEAYEYIITNAEDLVDVKHILKYRAGYVPKFNDKVRYLVKRPVMGSINGIRRGNAYHKVDQAFSTSQKAAKYAETVPDALVVPAREFTTEDTVQAFDMFGGNMYTGGRKAGGLKVDGVEATRVRDPLEATNMALEYLQRKKILGKVTQVAEEQWLQTASKYMPELTEYKGSFEGAVDILRTNDASVTDRLKSLHTYIVERKSHNAGRANDLNYRAIKLAESIRLDSGLSRMMWAAADANLLTKAKGLTYHAFLGTFNVAQFPVQASALMLPLAKHPVAFTKALPEIMTTFLLEFIPSLGRKIVDGWSPKKQTDFRSAYFEWVESGMRSSIRNNPDLARVSSMPLVERLEYMSTFFVEQGEALSRMGSFFTARQLKGAGNLRETLVEARKLGMDMSTANKSWWQDGFPGVFLQFSQILAKTYGEMIPKAFGGKASVTGLERARLFIASLATFGIAGIPFGTLIDEVAHKLLPDNSDPTFVEAYKRGLSGVIMNTIDWDNDIQSRMSLATALPMMIEKVVLGSDISGDDLMGPVGAIFSRIGQVATDTYHGHRTGNWTPAIRAATSIPSSFRNAWVAYIHTKTNALYSLSNKESVNIDLNNAERVLLAMGFQPTELRDYYTIKERERSKKDVLDYMVNTTIKSFKLGELSSEEVDTLGFLAGFDRDLLNSYNEALRKRLRNLYQEPIRDKMIDGLLRDSKTFGVPTAARLLEGE